MRRSQMANCSDAVAEAYLQKLSFTSSLNINQIEDTALKDLINSLRKNDA